MKEPSLLDDDWAFAQQLLEAGRAETLSPRQTRAALLRFTTAIAAVTAGAVVAPGASASNVVNSGTSLAAIKWLALGALAGGIATFSWLQHSVPTPATSRAVVPPSSAPVVAAVEPRPVVIPSPHSVPDPPTARPRAASVARSSTPSTSASAVATAGSDLAAEVAALDRVRTAMAIGAWSEAERQLALYRSDFARGAMRREAEVLSLDVLVAQGHKQAAARAAERFIAQHPRDPQVARMRAFLD